MFWTLLKKQLLEVNAFYRMNRKTGKWRSKKETVLFLLLYAFLFVFLGFAFFSICMSFTPLLQTETPWLYGSLTGILSILFGLFGSVFTTYASVYNVKDNDLLFSMPIRPLYILGMRISGVACMGLLYELLILLPGSIARCLCGPVTALGIVNMVLLPLFVNLFITALSCALGWVVALVSGRLKNKSFITVLLSLTLIVAYYAVIGRSEEWLLLLVTNDKAVGGAIRTWAYPFYLLGRAFEGDAGSMLLFMLLSMGLFTLVFFVMAKSFLRMNIRNTGSTKKVYVEKTMRSGSVLQALFRKESKRLTGSAAYMLNGALGTVFMPVIGILLLVNRAQFSVLREILSAMELENLLPILVVGMTCLVSTMNMLTAPSISLEGKNLWILQSAPVSARSIFNAKQLLHLAVTVPPALLMVLCVGIALKLDVLCVLCCMVVVVLFILLMSGFGLAMGLKFPNLNWVNETVAIKQGTNVFFALFGGWLFAVITAGVSYALSLVLPVSVALLFVGVLLGVAVYFVNRWLQTRGAQIFYAL